MGIMFRFDPFWNIAAKIMLDKTFENIRIIGIIHFNKCHVSRWKSRRNGIVHRQRSNSMRCRRNIIENTTSAGRENRR